MKKLFMMLSVLSLAGSLYAGAACCAVGKTAEKTAEKPAEKVEKIVCADCSKAEGLCESCKAIKVKAEEKVEEKTEVKS